MCFCFLVCFGLFWCVMVCFGVFWCVLVLFVFLLVCVCSLFLALLFLCICSKSLPRGNQVDGLPRASHFSILFFVFLNICSVEFDDI